MPLLAARSEPRCAATNARTEGPDAVVAPHSSSCAQRSPLRRFVARPYAPLFHLREPLERVDGRRHPLAPQRRAHPLLSDLTGIAVKFERSPLPVLLRAAEAHIVRAPEGDHP